jgi:hypothetical protein
MTYTCGHILRNNTNSKFTSRSPTDKNTKHAQMTYTCDHILRNNTKPNERKSAGGIAMAQSAAEDPLKMVEKKDQIM